MAARDVNQTRISGAGDIKTAPYSFPGLAENEFRMANMKLMLSQTLFAFCALYSSTFHFKLFSNSHFMQ